MIDSQDFVFAMFLCCNYSMFCFQSLHYFANYLKRAFYSILRILRCRTLYVFAIVIFITVIVDSTPLLAAENFEAPDFQVTLRVAVAPQDIAPQAQGSSLQQLVRQVLRFFAPFDRVAQATSSVDAKTFVSTEPVWMQLLRAVSRPEPTLIFVFLFLASLCYALYVTRGTKHFFTLFYKPRARLFHDLARRNSTGTYLHSYARFHLHAFLSKHFALVSGFLLFAKVTVVAGLATLLLDFPLLSRATERDVPVFPGAMLTYHIEYDNQSDTSLSRVQFSHVFPPGTAYVPGTFLWNNISLTDVADEDGFTITDGGFTLQSNQLPVGTGSFSWNLRVAHTDQTNAIASKVGYQIDDGLLQQTNTFVNPVVTLTISGKAFYDVNRNNVFDATTETGIADVHFALYEDTNQSDVFDGTDTLLAEMNTAEQGLYHFSGLRPGLFFVKVVDAREGPYELLGGFQEVRLQALESVSSQDVAYILPDVAQKSTVMFGTLWHDIDRNQQHDDGETNFSDIELRLYRDAAHKGVLETLNDTLVASTFTDEDGRFRFLIPEEGDYFVLVLMERLPQGYTLTTANQPKRIAVDVDTSETNVDSFGYALPTSSIGDEVFEDSNNNTLHDATEAGFSDVQVLLYRDDGSEQFEEALDNRIAETFTDSQGKYLFSHVASGGYFVMIDTATLPDESGYRLTTASNPRFVEIVIDTDQMNLLSDFGFRSETVGNDIPSSSGSQSNIGTGATPQSASSRMTTQSAQVPTETIPQTKLNVVQKPVSDTPHEPAVTTLDVDSDTDATLSPQSVAQSEQSAGDKIGRASCRER